MFAGTSLPHSERTPLLGNEATIENGDDNGITRESSSSTPEDVDVPLAEELTTKQLLLVLSSIWVGVFLAALGIYAIQPPPFHSGATNLSHDPQTPIEK